jgi:hypothetical protein
MQWRKIVLAKRAAPEKAMHHQQQAKVDCVVRQLLCCSGSTGKRLFVVSWRRQQSHFDGLIFSDGVTDSRIESLTWRKQRSHRSAWWLRAIVARRPDQQAGQSDAASAHQDDASDLQNFDHLDAPPFA